MPSTESRWQGRTAQVKFLYFPWHGVKMCVGRLEIMLMSDLNIPVEWKVTCQDHKKILSTSAESFHFRKALLHTSGGMMH